MSSATSPIRPMLRAHKSQPRQNKLARTFVPTKSPSHAILNRKPRIAFLNHTAQPGGGELALVELIRHLDRDRVEPIVVLFSTGPLCELLQGEAEVHILPLPSTIFATRKDALGLYGMLKRGRSVLVFALRLRKLLQRLDLDIVHTNSLKACVLGGIAARLSGLLVLWHVRDRIAPDYLPRPATFAFKLAARIIPNYLVANSASTLKCLGGWSMLKPKKVAVVHDGVNLSKFEASPPRSHNRCVMVALVGRISPWKGQDVFLRAADQIRHRFPSVRFLIIGSSLFGEDQFEYDIRSLCSQLDLWSHVEFTGFEKHIHQRLSQVDILVHASTLPEPFGQVIIEAMAAAKPIVATDGGGVREIVLDGITGLLVPIGDADRMADTICRLIADPVLRAEMGHQGRKRVLQQFTVEKTVTKMHTVYDRMVARRAHSSTR